MIKYSKTKKIRNEALSRLDHFRFFGDSNLFRISCFDIRISASTLFPHHRISTPEASRRLAGGANHRTNTKMRTSPGGATEWAPRNFAPSDSLHKRLSTFANRPGNPREVAFFPKCFVWIHLGDFRWGQQTGQRLSAFNAPSVPRSVRATTAVSPASPFTKETTALLIRHVRITDE